MTRQTFNIKTNRRLASLLAVLILLFAGRACSTGLPDQTSPELDPTAQAPATASATMTPNISATPSATHTRPASASLARLSFASLHAHHTHPPPADWYHTARRQQSAGAAGQ